MDFRNQFIRFEQISEEFVKYEIYIQDDATFFEVLQDLFTVIRTAGLKHSAYNTESFRMTYARYMHMPHKVTIYSHYHDITYWKLAARNYRNADDFREE